jgi:hypothetical protein
VGYSERLDIAIPALLPVAPYWQRPVQRSVEELELTVEIDVGPRFPSSCRHALRLAWRGRQYLANSSPPLGGSAVIGPRAVPSGRSTRGSK